MIDVIVLKDTARKYGLEPELVHAIATVESSLNPFETRFEPTWYDKLKGLDIHPISPCTRETERISRCISWGVMQVLGATARDIGYKGPFLSELSDFRTGLEVGCQYLQKQMIKYKDKGLEAVISAYNGGSPLWRITGSGFVNSVYIQSVMKIYGESKNG